MSTILVVDDERGVLQAFHEMLSGLGHNVLTESNSNAALEIVRKEHPDLVVTDLCMPGLHGLDALRQIRSINARLPVIIMTGRGTMDTAIEATKLGAFDYQLKPFNPESMLAAIDRALEGVRLMKRSVELNPTDTVGQTDAIIGECAGMQDVFKAIGRVAATDATVLIRGESGTGKELVGRAIYQHSLRHTRPLLVVNCAAIPEALLESELFGHERGAFTGAQARRIGRFEQADGGTILLDEVGEIPAPVQAKMLRLLQQKTFERLGSNQTIQTDVRIIAATNRDMERSIQAGTFREDLYHRLNVVTIQIPSLRERRGDIPKLVDYFLSRYSEELKIERPVVSDAAMELICSIDWPGNVRELEHCIYRSLIFTRGYPIQVSDISHAREPGQDDKQAAAFDYESLNRLASEYLDHQGGEGALDRLIENLERAAILEALQRTAGNQSKASLLLGVTRPTLHAKIQRYGIALAKR